jgi:polysaccharide deacetylase family protein (PEP-CTERM system associated)
MKNALSIDLEDWFCVYNFKSTIKYGEWCAQDTRVIESTNKILDVLKKHETKATFFVLGWIAERVPYLISNIENNGHEIASHGYSHRLITEMTPEEFEEDLEKAFEVTKECVNQDIIGFRAPSFSLVEKTIWALDILNKFGFKYDSSVFPVGFHPDYGMTSAPLSIHRTKNSIIEFPISCVEFFGQRIPCGGGGYFRMYPYWLTKALIRKCNREGRPVVFYLHPWEIDKDQPRVKLSPMKRFRHYFNLDKTLERFDRLLNDFEFTSVREVIGL